MRISRDTALSSAACLQKCTIDFSFSLLADELRIAMVAPLSNRPHGIGDTYIPRLLRQYLWIIVIADEPPFIVKD